MNMRATILAALLGSTIFTGAALAADTSNVPLVTAAKLGDRAAVRSLLNGIPQKVIAGPEGTAALVWATSRNDAEMVGLLIRGRRRERQQFGATALYAAAANPDAAVTRHSGRGRRSQCRSVVGRDGAHGSVRPATLTSCVPCYRPKQIPTRRKPMADKAP
jgi:hypothetical protein